MVGFQSALRMAKGIMLEKESSVLFLGTGLYSPALFIIPYLKEIYGINDIKVVTVTDRHLNILNKLGINNQNIIDITKYDNDTWKAELPKDEYYLVFDCLNYSQSRIIDSLEFVEKKGYLGIGQIPLDELAKDKTKWQC